MANICGVCGANLDMVGRVHRCIARPIAPAPAEAVRAGPGASAGSGVVAVASAGTSTYAHRKADERRAYMRDYMKRRRDKHGV